MARCNLFITLAICSLASIVSAYVSFPKVHNLNPHNAYMPLSLRHDVEKPHLEHGVAKVPISSDPIGYAYLVDITIGSGNQTVPVLFDTGSSLTWVNPDCSKVAKGVGQSEEVCSRYPRYKPFSSKSAKILNESMNQTYGLGGVLGTWFSEHVTLGGLTARDQHLGVAAASYDYETGIFGAGLKRSGGPCTIIETLAEQGRINSYAFSMSLPAVNDTGTLILGGIDTKKYKGSLGQVHGTGYRAIMTEIGITLPNKTSITYERTLWNHNNTDGLAILLDSGTPVNLLPNDLMFAIGDHYPDAEMYMNNDGPAFKVPCDAPEGTFDYTFGRTKIRVPFRDAVFKNPAGICSFGFRMGPDDPKLVPYILGATFLRGAYVVFDHANDQMWMAEAADCGSSIAAIEKGRSGVPMIPGCASEAGNYSRPGYAPPPQPKIVR